MPFAPAFEGNGTISSTRQGVTLVTGATGFVGRFFVESLLRLGCPVRSVTRRNHDRIPGGVVVVPAIDSQTDWNAALEGVEVVVHLAALVHQSSGGTGPSLEDYREINLLGTENLARSAAAAGVRRFVFVSSIKAEQGGQQLKQKQKTDYYAVTKREAESLLWKIGGESGMEILVVRPPLVYGPGVKANYLALLRLVDRGIPLPLGAVENRRSMIYVENLVDFLCCCAINASLPSGTFTVSDGEDLSTPDLIRRIAAAMGRRAMLLPCPISILKGLGRILGRSGQVERLCGSLTVGSCPDLAGSGWTPPFTVNQGIERTVRWYMSDRDGLAD